MLGMNKTGTNTLGIRTHHGHITLEQAKITRQLANIEARETSILTYAPAPGTKDLSLKAPGVSVPPSVLD
jgi:hypothetical protein